MARPTADPRVALTVSFLGFFVITLDALIVSVALPAVSRDLGGGVTGLQWVVDGYTLAFASLVLLAGSVSDRVGARTAYGAGLLAFVVASAACAFAPSLAVLVAARVLQGAGAAVMTPPSLALIREAYADAGRRAHAIAVWGMGGALASALGPVLGGVMTLVSWRLIFVVNLPVGLAALLLLRRVGRSPSRPATFDPLGQLLAVVFMVAVTYAAVEASVVPALVGLLALLAFVAVESRISRPMVPLGLFRSRNLVVPVLGGFAFTVGNYGMVFLMSLYLQQHLGLTALEAGLVFLPSSLLLAGTNLVAARLAVRFGPRVPITAGQLCQAAGLLALAAVAGRAAGAPAWVIALLLVPVGLGGALAVPSATAVLVGSVPGALTGTASGILNTARQLGGALAVAAFGAVVARSGFVVGTRVSLAAAAALLLVVALASRTLRRPSPSGWQDRSRDRAPRRRSRP